MPTSSPAQLLLKLDCVSCRLATDCSFQAPVAVAGGAPVNQTAELRGADGTPLYSPDGKYLAFLSQQRAGFEADVRALNPVVPILDVSARTGEGMGAWLAWLENGAERAAAAT